MSKADLRNGMTKWVCWCGLMLRVSADTDDDSGWAQVREHRAEHKKDRKVVPA